MAAGYPLNSYIFAQIIVVFTYSGQQLTNAANFWALMFFVLAIGIGIGYAILGFSLHSIAVVRSNELQQ